MLPKINKHLKNSLFFAVTSDNISIYCYQINSKAFRHMWAREKKREKVAKIRNGVRL